MKKLARAIIAILFKILMPIRNALQFSLVKLNKWKFHLNYRARADDIFVVSYPKCGTTWMQNIVYQLAKGDMDFPHINAVALHLEEDVMGSNLNLESLPSPRLFKSHLSYDSILKGRGKYIYVMRNGLDAAVSYFHHYVALRRFQADFNFFFRLFMTGKVAYGSWFDHVAGWLSHKDDLDILFVKYEDLLEDLEGNIRRIAEFCNFPVDEARIQTAVERSRFEFMKAHGDQFDLGAWLAQKAGFTTGKFFREGKKGGGESQMDQRQIEEYRARFRESLAGLGVDDYAPPQ